MTGLTGHHKWQATAQAQLTAASIQTDVTLHTTMQVLRVRSCVAGSHAQQVLHDGDLVLAVAGQPVTSFTALEGIIASYCSPADESSDTGPQQNGDAGNEGFHVVVTSVVSLCKPALLVCSMHPQAARIASRPAIQPQGARVAQRAEATGGRFMLRLACTWSRPCKRLHNAHRFIKCLMLA